MRCVTTRLNKFFRLNAGDRRLLVVTALLHAGIRLGLWLLPFHLLRQILARAASPPRASTAAPSPDRVAWALAVIGRMTPWATTCLTLALTAQVVLTRMGLPARLRLGAAKGPDGAVQAHAWVECGGAVIIGGSNVHRYAAFPALTLRQE